MRSTSSTTGSSTKRSARRPIEIMVALPGTVPSGFLGFRACRSFPPHPSARRTQDLEQTYFRKGFGLKKDLKPLIDAEYQSALVERIRGRGYTDSFGDVTVRLAQEFGFCYGVDRAVDYAYETVHNF